MEKKEFKTFFICNKSKYMLTTLIVDWNRKFQPKDCCSGYEVSCRIETPT